MKKLRIAVYTLDLPEYACTQLRVLQPALHLADTITLDWCTQNFGDDYRISETCMDAADLILFQRTFPQQHTWPVIIRALRSGKPVLYDLDDDFFSIPGSHPLARRITTECVPFAKKLLKRAHLVTVSTPTLRDALRPLTTARMEVLPNFLPDRLWRPAMPIMRPDAPLIIGFAGTVSHKQDLALIEEVLIHTAERFGERVGILFFGCRMPTLERLPQVRTKPSITSYEDYAAALPAQGVHIGLAPLLNDTFNRSKSDIKWQEYTSGGICGIFSDMPPYSLRVRAGENGLLAGPAPEDWEQALALLLENPQKCRRMVLAAQEELQNRSMLSRGAGRYLAVWKRAARHFGPPSCSELKKPQQQPSCSS